MAAKEMTVDAAVVAAVYQNWVTFSCENNRIETALKARLCGKHCFALSPMTICTVVHSG